MKTSESLSRTLFKANFFLFGRDIRRKETCVCFTSFSMVHTALDIGHGSWPPHLAYASGTGRQKPQCNEFAPGPWHLCFVKEWAGRMWKNAVAKSVCFSLVILMRSASSDLNLNFASQQSLGETLGMNWVLFRILCVLS